MDDEKSSSCPVSAASKPCWRPGANRKTMPAVPPKNRQTLAARVANAAAAALQEHGFVSAIEVMVGIGWLRPNHLLEWRTSIERAS